MDICLESLSPMKKKKEMLHIPSTAKHVLYVIWEVFVLVRGLVLIFAAMCPRGSVSNGSVCFNPAFENSTEPKRALL